MTVRSELSVTTAQPDAVTSTAPPTTTTPPAESLEDCGAVADATVEYFEQMLAVAADVDLDGLLLSRSGSVPEFARLTPRGDELARRAAELGCELSSDDIRARIATLEAEGRYAEALLAVWTADGPLVDTAGALADPQQPPAT